MRKVVAAALLSARIGECFSAMVTGSSPKGTYARLVEFPAEGKREVLSIQVGKKVYSIRYKANDAGHRTAIEHLVRNLAQTKEVR